MPRNAVLIALLVLLLVSLPYLAAASVSGDETVFAGFLYNPLDGNSYLAKMYQGWRGDWLFTLPYTAEPGAGELLFPFYLLLGHLARWLNLPLALVFHLARLAAAAYLLIILWVFLARFRPGGRWPVLVYALAALGLGLGWLVFPFGYVTTDFWVAEAYPFLSAYATPHFAFSLALLLWLVIPPTGDLAGRPRSTRWRGMLAGLAAFFLAWLSAFGVVIALAMQGGWLAWEVGRAFGRTPRPNGMAWVSAGLQRRSWLWRRFLWTFVGGAPPVIYQTWSIRTHPVLSIWNAQNLTLTPPLWDLAIAFSPALLAALVAAWFLWKDRDSIGWPVLIWVVGALALVYFPFGLQRRFLIGVYAPLVALAGYGLEVLSTRAGRRAERLPGVLLGLSLPTVCLVLLVGLFGIQQRSPLFYLQVAEDQALDWIQANTAGDALVLSSPESGLFIPARTGRRVIYGHPFETVNAEQEQQAVLDFFQGQMENPVEFLRERGVNYILYGPREQALGALPADVPLQEVFSQADVKVFQVLFPGESRRGNPCGSPISDYPWKGLLWAERNAFE